MDFQFHLRKLLQHEEGNAKVKLSPEEIHHHLHNISMMLIACYVLVFVFTISIILRIYYSRRRRRQNNHNITNTSILLDDIDVHGDSLNSPNSNDDVVEQVIEHPIWHIRSVGLLQSVIDSITVFKYKKDEEGLSLIDGTECSVCLCEFQHEESLKLLPKCNHAFHISCIDTWLTSHKNCPLCRAPIVIDQLRDLNDSSGEPLNQENHQIIDNFDHRVAVEGSYSNSNNNNSGISIGDISDKVLSVRKSVSVDLSSSTSVIFRDEDVVELERSLGSEDHFQKRTVSMRKSFSHNRKFLFSRHCRSQSLTLPL